MRRWTQPLHHLLTLSNGVHSLLSAPLFLWVAVHVIASEQSYTFWKLAAIHWCDDLFLTQILKIASTASNHHSGKAWVFLENKISPHMHNLRQTCLLFLAHAHELTLLLYKPLLSSIHYYAPSFTSPFSLHLQCSSYSWTIMICGSGPCGSHPMQTHSGHPAAQPGRTFFPSRSNPGTTTGCARAREPEHLMFWMESHQQEGRDALGVPL